MHSSLFTYPVTRSYPFRWFTPLVFIGGTVAAVVFSMLNIVTNNYSWVVEVTSNTNITIPDNHWFRNSLTNLEKSAKPGCQPMEIPVNSKVFTNKNGLVHTLVRVWHHNATIDKDHIYPSLAYHHNEIQNCKIYAIYINLASQDRTATQQAWSQWGASLMARTTCSIARPYGLRMFELQTDFDYIPEAVTFDKYTLGRMIVLNKDASANLWWGQSLLSVYYMSLARTMADTLDSETSKARGAIRKGYLAFTTPDGPNSQEKVYGNSSEPPRVSQTDITKLDFFKLKYYFVPDQRFDNSSRAALISNKLRTTPLKLNANETFPNIWIPADNLAKSFYSTILTDLGQKSFPKTNILNDSTMLQHFTSNFSSMAHNLDNKLEIALEDYSTLESKTGPLHIMPSTFGVQYVCQIPKWKSPGTIFVTVLMTDLVFLHALYQLLTFITNHIVLRTSKKRAQVNYCEGCLKREMPEEQGPLEPEAVSTSVLEQHDMDGDVGDERGPKSVRRRLLP